MKRILAVLFLVSLPAWAGMVATNSFDLQSVASTTATGITNTVSSMSIPAHQFIIQHGALGSTNTQDLRVAVQLSLDGENWTTVTNYYPSATNANVETFYPYLSRLTGFMRVQVQTSNTISVGIISTKAQ